MPARVLHLLGLLQSNLGKLLLLQPQRHSQSQQGQMHAPSAAAATELSHELQADEQIIYAIVNEFLVKVTFNNPEAEALLVAALVDESSLSLQMSARLEEVFLPIFFHYPNGLKDRSVWQPIKTKQYIRRCYGAQQLPLPQSTAQNSARPK